MNLRMSALLVSVAIFGTAAVADAKVTLKKIEKAETVAEFESLGAAKLSASQFKSSVVGKPMSGDKGSWTWIIDKDGTTTSASSDGSWHEDDQPWTLKGDQYCAPLQGKTKCRDVYLLGNYLRMSDQNDATKLSSWTAMIE